MRYPLVSLCVAFSLGIWVAEYLAMPFFILLLLAFLFLVSSAIFIKHYIKFSVSILLVFLLLGAALLKNSQILPTRHIANLTTRADESICLIGIISSDPIHHKRSVSFILKTIKFQTNTGLLNAEKIDKSWQETCGDVLVKVFSFEKRLPFRKEKKKFSYGDVLLLEGRLYRPFSFSKEFNYREYLKHQSIYSILSVKRNNLIKWLDGNRGNPLKSFAFRIRHKLSRVFIENLPPLAASILDAIILGERHSLPFYVRDVLIKSGTIHIIAISGLHLGIVAFIILVILKIIRIPRKTRYILTMFILIGYCIMTGVKTPVMRATIMAIILLMGHLFEREVNIYNSLALAALIILIANPWQLFEISFQLSFLSVASIALLTPKIKPIFPERLYKIKWVRFLISAFSVSVSAWLGLLPLIAYYFRIISPITVLANMIIIPYVSIIVASGFVLAFGGVLVPSLVSMLAASCEVFILILLKINSLLISVPGAYFKLSRVSAGFVLIYYVLIFFFFYIIERFRLRQKV